MKEIFNKKLEIINECIEYYPEHPQAYSARGNIYFEMGKLDKARLDFEKAISLGYEGTNALINLGVTYLSDPQKAQPFFEKALEIDPLCALAFGYLSACSNNLSNYKESLNYANKAIDINGSNMYFFEQRSKAHAGLDRHEEAIKDLDIVLDNNVRDSDFI